MSDWHSVKDVKAAVESRNYRLLRYTWSANPTAEHVELLLHGSKERSSLAGYSSEEMFKLIGELGNPPLFTADV